MSKQSIPEKESRREKAVARAETRQEAVAAVARKLEKSPDDLHIQVLQEGSSGFLGFFEKPWIVRGRPKRERDSMRDATIEEALRVSEAVDGSFQLDVDGRKVYLTVHPPSGAGRPVDPDTVILHLTQIGADYCDFDEVRTVVGAQEGEPKAIGQLPEGERTDTGYEVEISDDGLQATMTLLPPKFGGEDPKLKPARRALDEAGVTEGIDWDSLEHMIEDRRYREEVVIARGRDPEPGEEGEIKYYFQTQQQPDFSEEKEQVNFRELGLVQNVEEGELLAEKVPPTPGRSGLSVTGESIDAAEGDEAELQYGEGVREEDEKLYADREGNVDLVDGVVQVHELYQVDGDVDYSTGNIEFNGTVVVTGSVQDLFRIEAGGDILVEEQVGRAYLDATGDIIVQGGVQGKGDARIQAQGSFAAEFVQQANIVAQKHVIIDELILHSQVDAGESVYVGDGKGLLAGGRIRAGVLVYAREIGSVGASSTRVEVGIDPQFFRDLARLEADISEQKQKLDKVERAIDTLEGREDLNEEQQRNLDQLVSNRNNLQRNLDNLEEEKQTLARRAEIRPGARIMASDVIRPGCRVTIGNQIYNVNEPLQTCGLRRSENRVEQMTFEKPAKPNLD